MVFTLGSSKEVLQTRNQTFKFSGNSFLPSKAFIPIGYDDDVRIFVNRYSRIKEGELIARGDSLSPFAYIHSSIPGIVTGFNTYEVLPNKILKTIEISLEGSFDILGKPSQNNNWQELTPIELFDKIEKKGIVNTSNRLVHSLYADLKNIMENQDVELATSLFDFYPSQSLDGFLTEEYMKEITEASLIIAKIIGSKKITFFHNKKNKNQLKKYMDIAYSICENC